MKNKQALRLYVYHETKRPSAILFTDLEEFKAKGWNESPLAFFKPADHGLDITDKVMMTETGKALVFVAKVTNETLNLDLMTKPELIKFAKDNYSKKLKMFDNSYILLKQCKELSLEPLKRKWQPLNT
jgi:hypothetical protein